MALIGAAVGAAMPGFAGANATQTRGALIGAVLGVVMSVVGVLLFWLLISGFRGA